MIKLKDEELNWGLAFCAAIALHLLVAVIFVTWPTQHNQLIKQPAFITASTAISSIRFPVKISEQSAAKFKRSNVHVFKKANVEIGRKPIIFPSLLSMIDQQIAANLTYPDDINAPAKATVWLHFMLEPDGRIVQLELLKSSGSQAFDNAAMQAVKLSSPVILPAKLSQPLSLTLPVYFA
jgi:TonB family protein